MAEYNTGAKWPVTTAIVDITDADLDSGHYYIQEEADRTYYTLSGTNNTVMFVLPSGIVGKEFTFQNTGYFTAATQPYSDRQMAIETLPGDIFYVEGQAADTAFLQIVTSGVMNAFTFRCFEATKWFSVGYIRAQSVGSWNSNSRTWTQVRNNYPI